MANPQTEKGYAYIPNGQIDMALQIDLDGIQFRILHVLWHYEYGSDTKADCLSELFIAERMSECIENIVIAVSGLIRSNIVLLSENDVLGNSCEIFLNDNHCEWVDAQSLDSPLANISVHLTVKRGDSS